MANFTQQQLRNLSPTVRGQMSRQVEQQNAYETSVRKSEQEQQMADEQKSNLQQRISQIKKDIQMLEYEESHTGRINPLEAASRKYGKQAELARLEEFSSNLSSGGYYSNYNELISSASAEGKYVASTNQANFNTAIQIRKTPSVDLPKGAKIISMNQGVITYTMPSSQVKEQIGTYMVDGQGMSIAPSIAENMNVQYQQQQISKPQGYSIDKGLAYFSAKPDNKFTPIKPGEINLGKAPNQSVKGEIYSDYFGGYIQPDTNRQFGQGTAVVRPQTYPEMREMDRITGVPSKIFGTSMSAHKWTESMNVLDKERTKLKMVRTNIEKYDNKIKDTKWEETPAGNIVATDNKWIGTQKELKDYNIQIQKYSSIGTRKQGFFGYTRDESIENYNFKNKPITSTQSMLTSGLSTTLGVFTEKKLVGFGVKAEKAEKIGRITTTVNKAGLTLGTYAIPVVGGVVWKAQIGEFGVDIGKTVKKKEKISPEQLKEGAWLATAIIGGRALRGLKFRRGTIKRPKFNKVESVVNVKYNPTLKYVNTPKVKTTVGASGKETYEIVRGGLSVTQRQINPISEVSSQSINRFTGKPGRWSSQYRADSFGNVIGSEIQLSRWGKFGSKKISEFTIKEGVLETQFYRTRILSGKKKLIHSSKGAAPTSQFKYGDNFKVLDNKVSKTIVLPDKQTVKVKLGAKKYEQELISLGAKKGDKVVMQKVLSSGKVREKIIKLKAPKVKGGKYLIEGELKTTQTSISGIVVAPAKLNPLSRLRNVITGGKVEGMGKEILRKKAKFAKTDSKDLLKLGDIKVLPKSLLGQSGRFAKSTRAEQLSGQEIVSGGKFIITPDKPINRFLRDRGALGLFKNKKAQSLLAPQLQRPMELPTVVKPASPLLGYKVNVKEVPLGQLSQAPNPMLDVSFNLPYKFKTRTFGMVEQETLIKTDLSPITRNAMILDTKLKLDTQVRETFQTRAKESLSLQPKTQSRQQERLQEMFKQVSKQQQQPLQKLDLKQQSRQTQTQQQKQPLKQKPLRIKTPPLNIPGSNKMLQRLSSKVGEFEAVGFRGGKPLSLGKFSEKSTAAKELKGFLKGTLSASGYLKKGKKKIRAKDTGLLGLDFRKGKKSSTLVVERKSKRLRKGTTGKQIQFFR